MSSTASHLRLARVALVYFLQVFGMGFALALIRIPFLVPRFGVRAAELIEMPVMLVVIVCASRYLARRTADLARSERLAAGMLALVLLAGAELAVAFTLGARSPSDYIAGRDPVSGGAYLLSLLFFAAAPALWRLPPLRSVQDR